MRSVATAVLACLVSSVAQPRPLLAQSDAGAAPMAGISNAGRDPRQPYVTAGDRAYLIGTQDGAFPDMGGHVAGEMGGLWVHPIKLVDGFWVRVVDRANGRTSDLARADELITYPYGTRLRYAPVLDGLEIERFQFSPDGRPGVVVQYRLRNPSDRARQLEFHLAVRTDLSPVWYSEHIGIADARDTLAWHGRERRFVGRDTENTWFVVWGSAEAVESGEADPSYAPPTRGMGVAGASRYRLSLAPGSGSTLTFVFAGSARSESDALQAYSHLTGHHAALLEEKQAHYAGLLDRARVRIPDRRLQEVYDWVRVNAEWLVREVPGLGRGLGAGLMEYPWWFGTETYSLQALMTTGDFELPRHTLRLLKRQSDRTNGNGRIVHEVTTAGAVSNPGNSQETAQFILTVGELLDWSGDLGFAREMYPAMRQGLDWLLGTMDRNRNLFPGGYGIMEVYGLDAELIDVAVYTQQALVATARVGEVLGDSTAAARYRRLAAELKAGINERFWIEEEESYADFHGTTAQAVSAAKGAMKQVGLKGEDQLTGHDRRLMERYADLARSFSRMGDTTRGWLTNENWVIATPMERGIAPRSRAIRVLDRIRSESVGEHGPYLSAVERDRMMTIATGVQAVAEARYGRTEEALWYMGRIVETFNRVTPGSISEMMPDGGCFTIAWTSYGIVVPLIRHVFGIEPDALKRTVVLDPHVPEGWEGMSIEALPIGNTLVSFSRGATGRGTRYTVESADSGWTFVLRTGNLPGARYYLNGAPVVPVDSAIRMRGRKNQVLVLR